MPEALNTSEAFNLYEALRLVVEQQSEYRIEITDYWRVFEIHTIEESYGAECEAARLAEEGNKDKARDLLTMFCENKCEKAMAAAQDMFGYLNKLPILGVKVFQLKGE